MSADITCICGHDACDHKQDPNNPTSAYACTECFCAAFFKRRSEAVNHPSHYGGDTVYEAIKVIEAWDLGFHLGNAVKYISRAGKKDPAKEIEDLEKAAWYLNRRIEQLKVK